MYTVKKLAALAGITPRTLHYYDEIGLLRPASHGENGYRYYSAQDALQLQQILFYRELGFSLEEIREITGRKDFDLLRALEDHRTALHKKAARLQRLIHTVEKTIDHMKGNTPMSQNQLFEGFSEEKQKKYEEEMTQKYGETVQQSVRLWNSYSDDKKKAILAEAGGIYADLVKVMDQSPSSPVVQALVARWHQNMRYFYEPTPEIMRGLAQMYVENEEFQATFARFHPELAPFLRAAIEAYVDNLEK